MKPSNQLIDTFLASLRISLKRYEHDRTEVGDEVRRVLDMWPVTPSDGNPSQAKDSPVAQHLAGALLLGDQGDESDLASTIRPLAPLLHWTFGYQAHSQFPDLDSHVAFAQLVGPRDLANTDRLLMGLTLLAPHTFYPAHVHPAHEIYLPIGGTGLWCQGGAAPEPKVPGSIILHKSGVAHATESQDDPVLAVYVWRGDLTSPSTFLMDS